jgi:hypothetical protein
MLVYSGKQAMNEIGIPHPLFDEHPVHACIHAVPLKHGVGGEDDIKWSSISTGGVRQLQAHKSIYKSAYACVYVCLCHSKQE